VATIAVDWIKKVFAGTRRCELCAGSGVDPVKHRVTGEEVKCRVCKGGGVHEQIDMIPFEGGAEVEAVIIGMELGRHGESIVYRTPVQVLADKYKVVIEDDVTYPTDDAKKKACYDRMESKEKELFGKLGWGG